MLHCQASVARGSSSLLSSVARAGGGGRGASRASSPPVASGSHTMSTLADEMARLTRPRARPPPTLPKGRKALNPHNPPRTVDLAELQRDIGAPRRAPALRAASPPLSSSTPPPLLQTTSRNVERPMYGFSSADKLPSTASAPASSSSPPSSSSSSDPPPSHTTTLPISTDAATSSTREGLELESLARSYVTRAARALALRRAARSPSPASLTPSSLPDYDRSEASEINLESPSDLLEPSSSSLPRPSRSQPASSSIPTASLPFDPVLPNPPLSVLKTPARSKTGAPAFDPTKPSRGYIPPSNPNKRPKPLRTEHPNSPELYALRIREKYGSSPNSPLARQMDSAGAIARKYWREKARAAHGEENRHRNWKGEKLVRQAQERRAGVATVGLDRRRGKSGRRVVKSEAEAMLKGIKSSTAGGAIGKDGKKSGFGLKEGKV